MSKFNKVIISIDEETDTYSCDFSQVNVKKLKSILIQLIDDINSGKLLKNPGIETVEDKEPWMLN